MKILVDADACPVKSIIVDEAKKQQIEVIMFIDTSHVLNDGYSKIIMVDKGRDSVDFALVNMVTKGDIVVTQDYEVAALALTRGAYPINQNGLIYDKSNIDSLLFQRFLSNKVRQSGGRVKGVGKRTKDDDEKFRHNFSKLISHLTC